MRKKCLLTLTLILMLTFPVILVAQNSDVKWDFPKRPGFPEWKSLRNSKEKILSCQIPEEILPILTTDQLIDLCLRYPLVEDIFAFNSIMDGLTKYSIDFNGFQELVKRDDAALGLLKVYNLYDPAGFNANWTTEQICRYIIKISLIELFLSDQQILSKFDHTEKINLMNQFQLAKSKKESHYLYKGLGFQTLYLAMVKIINSDDKNLYMSLDSNMILTYVYSGILISPNAIEEIDAAISNYLSK